MYNKLKNNLTKAENNRFVKGVNTELVQFTQSLFDVAEGDVAVEAISLEDIDSIVV